MGSPLFVPPVPSEPGLKMLPVRRDGAGVLASALPPPRPRALRPVSGSTALGPRGSCTTSSAACRSCRWIRHTARAAWSTPKSWEESWAPQQARRNGDSLGQGTRPPSQPHPSKRCRAPLPNTPRGVVCNLGTLGRSHRHHVGLRDMGIMAKGPAGGGRPAGGGATEVLGESSSGLLGPGVPTRLFPLCCFSSALLSPGMWPWDTAQAGWRWRFPFCATTLTSSGSSSLVAEVPGSRHPTSQQEETRLQESSSAVTGTRTGAGRC